MIVANRSYWQGLGEGEPSDPESPDNLRPRRFVTAVSGSTVSYVLPVSGRRATSTLAAFEAWIAP